MLTGLVVGVAVMGLVLCFLLWLQVREVSQVSSLKRHRSKQAGLADLLNYAAVVEDGVVICKNGGLLAAWSYQGADNESSTHDEREVVSFRINQIVSQLGNGWMWHVDALRTFRTLSPGRLTKNVGERSRRMETCSKGSLF